MTTPDVRSILQAARSEGRTALSEWQAKRILAAYGVAVPRARLLPAQPAPCVLEGLRPPFALKVVARDLLHKTEAGGVRLGLTDNAAVAQAIAEMTTRIAAAGYQIEAWLVEEMAPPGIEMVIGGLHDARFGPVVMCGFGGILVELLHDISFAICPIDATDCDALLATLRGRALLNGWRGAPAAAVGALRQILLSVGGLGGMLETLGPELAELDINPLIVSATGAVAVDARIVLGA